MGDVRARLFTALLLLAIAPALPVAAEGYEETEHRLKTAGVDADLREKIHAAIRRGVERLRAQQWKRGNFPGPGSSHGAGHTALAALALRHAAIPHAVEGVRPAIAWLAKYAGKEVREETYTAGITAMLLQADAREPKLLRSIHEHLARGPQRSHGYWGYGTSYPRLPANLSTAQFGCLGLWAAERAGAPAATRAWQDHLRALLLAQRDDGSWSYYAATDTEYSAKIAGTYPTGTFMGLANLVLAHHALREEIEAEPERHAKVLVARAKGRAALRRHAQWTLGAPRMPGPLGTYALYRFYALEKVSIFLGLEELGGVPWYREGARWLLASQAGDGGWMGPVTAQQDPPKARARSRPMYTSFALLFLLRVSESYRPITPRPVDAPDAVTPRGADEPPPPAPAATQPQLQKAMAALDRIEDALDGERLTEIAPLRDALRLVARTYRLSFRDGAFVSKGHDTWARRAEELLLACAVRFTRAKANDRLLWQALALDALERLGGAHPRVGPALMERVLGIEHDKTFRSDLRFGWYGTAIDALRRLEPPGLLTWLCERALTDEPHLWSRSSATLTALGAMAPGLPGGKRFATARAILTRMVAVLRRSEGSKPVRDLVRDMQITLIRLTTGNDAEGFPLLEEAIVPTSGSQLLSWWARHSEPTDELWDD